MNGKDGKPFKTREGGVMRLENLIAEIQRGNVQEDHRQPYCRGRGSEEDCENGRYWLQLNTEICPIRLPKIMSSM